MFQTIYFEKEAKLHPNTKRILELFKPQNIIEIEKYTEIFNRRNQDFNLQKKNQKLILAYKKEHFVLETPEKCKLGTPKSYYFSHLYNCPFDCEYCYLKGTYSSGYLVLFVNFEDYFETITNLVQNTSEKTYFFSGFDCDSLALENITHFAQIFIPFFEKFQNTSLELRTKSANIQSLLQFIPPQNTVIAWTLTPQEIQKKYEQKTATLKQRLESIKILQKIGWRLGLRFEPMIYLKNWKKIYTDFFEQIKTEIDFSQIEDVNIGTLHYPKEVYKKMRQLMPQSKLITGPYELNLLGEMRYFQEINSQMKDFAYLELQKVLNKSKIFVV